MKRLLITLIGCLILVGATTASAATKTVSASGGGVTAKVTYTPTSQAPGGFKNPSISISGGKIPPYAAKVNIKACSVECQFLGKALAVKDLSHSGHYDAVLGVNTGGAHCCSYIQVYYPAGNTYKVSTRDFGDPGANLEDLNNNGKTEFVTADDSFAYLFSDYAESGLPLQILSFDNGKYTNVTRHYPKQLQKDAASWLKYYKQDKSSGRNGLIAAWAADEYNLGASAKANSTLQSEVAKHHITAKFVSQLKAYLKKRGY
ncbi:MAG: hypothetical protein J2O48_13085 [Solirubrobacterales bacterium]|nr:hypothetical protein [Solirubrobacterales bacterium]